MPSTDSDSKHHLPSDRVPFQKVALQLHPDDNVAIAKINLQSGMALIMESGTDCPIRNPVPAGHKIALVQICSDQPIRRYGQFIGTATRTINPGEHVHTHNVVVTDSERDCAIGRDAAPTAYVAEPDRRRFLGFRRADGRVGTRNFIAVVSTVNCSAHTCQKIADHFTPERLVPYPNVDGVIALTHTAGCGGVQPGSRDHAILQRTLAGMIHHPNVGASLVVGLGCETNQIDDLMEHANLMGEHVGTPPPVSLNIQDEGGVRPTVQAGISVVERLLPAVSATQRTRQPLAALTVALECGGSDSWSGITANPLMGRVADDIVRQGGTVVLSETTEIYGAEHLLTRRAVSPEVGQKLIDKIRWWHDYLDHQGVGFDNNPGPGNKAGGLTTIIEKSMGAISKAGTTNLVDVYDYAESLDSRGFVIMDTPAYDPVSVTGKVAGGCNLVLFSTGRGSVFGFKPAPSIKICSNSPTFHTMQEDMDLNAGRILEKDGSMHAISAELLDLIIAVASGAPSKSEGQGIGTAEFIPWQPGPIL